MDPNADTYRMNVGKECMGRREDRPDGKGTEIEGREQKRRKGDKGEKRRGGKEREVGKNRRV